MSASPSRPFLVLPVKPLVGGKQRLSRELPAGVRQLLARSLASRTVRCAAQSWPPQQVVVVGGDPLIDQLCLRLGVGSIAEAGAGQSAAVRAGQVWALERGATQLATVAADLPSVTVADLSRVLRLARRQAPGSMTLFPDQGGTGTNGMVLCPADLDPFSFGPDSHRRHREWARARGLGFEAVRIAGLAWDIDRPEDLLPPRASAAGKAHPVLGWARQLAGAGGELDGGGLAD